MPDYLAGLRRLLEEREALAKPLRRFAGGAVTIPVFRDDPAAEVQGYLDDLSEAIEGSGATLVMVNQLCRRPEGLRAAWDYPRAHLDYQPDAEELNNLRPDWARPAAPRVDWSGATSRPAGVGEEMEAAVRAARERFTRKGGRLADLDLTATSDTPAEPPPPPPPTPAPAAPAIALGVGPGLDLNHAGLAGPLGGAP